VRLARRHADERHEGTGHVAQCCLVLLSLRGRPGGEVVRRRRRRSIAGAGAAAAEGVEWDTVEDRA
jgi:hypothetical protein